MAISDGTVLRIVASLLFPDSVIAQNVFYAVFADTGGSNDTDDVLSDLADWVEAIYATVESHIPAVVALTGMKVYEYDAIDDDWDEVGDAVLSDSFAGAGDMLPHGVAGVIHAKSTDPDVQGAKYVGGIAELQCDDGTFTSSAVNALIDFANEWTAAYVGAATGADFGPGVWSPTHTNFFLFNGVEVVNAICGYQRRRKPGVGI